MTKEAAVLTRACRGGDEIRPPRKKHHCQSITWRKSSPTIIPTPGQPFNLITSSSRGPGREPDAYGRKIRRTMMLVKRKDMPSGQSPSPERKNGMLLTRQPSGTLHDRAGRMPDTNTHPLSHCPPPQSADRDGIFRCGHLCCASFGWRLSYADVEKHRPENHSGFRGDAIAFDVTSRSCLALLPIWTRAETRHPCRQTCHRR